MFVLKVFIPVLFLCAIVLLLSFLILFVKALLIGTGKCLIKINENTQVEVESGGTLLDNLLKLGYQIASPCGGKATCHQCKVKVTEGFSDPVEIEKVIFPLKKIKQGWRLSCQCKVRGDLKVVIDASAMNAKRFKAKVISNENVATFIKELCVEIPKDINLGYVPGDYLQVHLPLFSTNTLEWKSQMDKKFHGDWEKLNLFDKKIEFNEQGVSRAYSLASHKGEGQILKFTVRIATAPLKNGAVDPKIPWGVGSSYLFSLNAGDLVEFSGPYGESHMIENDKQLFFVIGGAGASFARAHILDLFLNKNTKRKVSLWYGARSLKENIYQSEFEDLAKKYPNFSYHLVLSEPEEADIKGGWPKDDRLKTGFACNAFIEGELKAMENAEENLYYVCGPPMHNKMVIQALYDFGVEKESIILDDFGN
jgi:Na+-transporting NADH:ubiquinone oxidoreductase subunit F